MRLRPHILPALGAVLAVVLATAIYLEHRNANSIWTGLLFIGGLGLAAVIMIQAWGRVTAARRRTLRQLQRIESIHKRRARQHAALLELLSLPELQDGNLSATLPRITRSVAGTLGADSVSIWRLEAGEDEQLTCLDSFDSSLNTHSSGRSIRSAEAPRYFQRIRTQRVLVSHDLTNDELAQELTYLSGSGVSALIDAPIFSEGRLAGVLCVSAKQPGRRWKIDEQDFVASVADSATLTFETHARRRLENLLQQKSAAIEAALDGIALLDESHRVIFANLAFARIFSAPSVDALLRRSWATLFGATAITEIEEDLSRLQRSGLVRTERILSSSGRQDRIVELSMTRLKEGAICVVRDVTDRRAIEENASRMALFTTLSPFPILRCDREGRILVANPAAEELITTPSGGVLQRKIAELVPEMAGVDFSMCIAQGARVSYTAHLGTRFYQCIVRGLPEYGFGNVYFYDITDLIRAREELTRHRAFLREVLDTVPSFIFAKDSAGRFTLANRAVADVYGTTTEAMIGKRDADFNPNCDEVEHFRNDDLEVINGGVEKFVPEERITDAKGKERWLQTIKRPLTLSSGETQVLGVATDITDSRALQEQLMQSQKMEAIGQLAGGIAHDFNNLLTAILGLSGSISLLSEKESEVSQAAELIDRTCRKAAELTQKLLAFARKGKHQHTLVDLREVVRETLTLIGRTFEKEIDLESEVACATPFVLGDPVLLQQIVLNLLLNARDAILATRDKANRRWLIGVTISERVLTRDEAEKVGCSILAGRRTLFLSVRDTGCGVAIEHRGKIFEPFFSTKDIGKGTGMGLSMVYGIARSHGGTALLMDSSSQGSQFDIILPATEACPLNRKIELIRGESGQRHGNILLVEDQEEVREVTRRMLHSMGYGVVTARDGVEALEYYRKNQGAVDLVILDLVMPRMGGRECFRAIRRLNPHVRAILSTGFVNNNVVQDILNEGVAGFVEKPYEISSLSDAVVRAIGPGEAAH